MAENPPEPAKKPAPASKPSKAKGPSLQEQATGVITAFQKAAEGVLENIFAARERGRQIDQQTTVKPSEKNKPERGSVALQRHFREFAWANLLIRWQFVGVLFSVAVALLAWLAYMRAYNRPDYYMVESGRLLNEQMEDFAGWEGVNYDHLQFFLLSTLSLLHRVDDGGAPYQPLLQGLINPEIYERKRKALQRNLAKIRKNLIVQNLNITRIVDLVVDQNTGRIGAYVRGYLTIQEQLADTGLQVHTLPYRARVVVDVNMPNKLNPYPYYLFSMDERVGDAVLEWDREQEKANDKR